MNCNRCDRDEDANDGPMNGCPECGLFLCDRCYGDRSFEWCAACRKRETEAKKSINAGNQARSGSGVALNAAVGGSGLEVDYV